MTAVSPFKNRNKKKEFETKVRDILNQKARKLQLQQAEKPDSKYASSVKSKP